MFLHVKSEDSDEIGQVPSLIWDFARPTSHFAGFVMRYLMCPFVYTRNNLMIM